MLVWTALENADVGGKCHMQTSQAHLFAACPDVCCKMSYRIRLSECFYAAVKTIV